MHMYKPLAENDSSHTRGIKPETVHLRWTVLSRVCLFVLFFVFVFFLLLLFCCCCCCFYIIQSYSGHQARARSLEVNGSFPSFCIIVFYCFYTTGAWTLPHILRRWFREVSFFHNFLTDWIVVPGQLWFSFVDIFEAFLTPFWSVSEEHWLLCRATILEDRTGGSPSLPVVSCDDASPHSRYSF